MFGVSAFGVRMSLSRAPAAGEAYDFGGLGFRAFWGFRDLGLGFRVQGCVTFWQGALCSLGWNPPSRSGHPQSTCTSHGPASGLL